MFKTKFDISSENFDLYFLNQANSLTPNQRELLPKDVLSKLFKGGAKSNNNNTSKLKFIEKIYILWKALKKRWWIVIEDENNGLTCEQFLELRDAIKRHEFDYKKMNEIISAGTFVTGSKELVDTFSYINGLNASLAYRYCLKVKGRHSNKVLENHKEITYLTKMFINYETCKKKLIQKKSLNVPELYVLMVLYDGEPIVSSTIHKEVLRYTFQSSQTKVKVAFGTLQSKGYITKIGLHNGAKMKITALGKSVINDIFQQYILNF